MRRAPFAAAVASICLILATALAGCQSGSAASPAPSTAPVGKSAQSIQVGGATRTFHLYRPQNLPAHAPLVVMLHGGFGSGTQAEQAYGWDQEADHNGFAVVYPDGLNHAWNTGGGCCGTPAKQNTDDVGFIKAMVTTIQGEIPIDPARVYATGISNGGIMAYRLACDTDLFAAIGPDSATLLGTCPSPKPLSVLHIHGTADTRLPYAGGEGQGYAHINGPPVQTVVATWRTTDACAPPTSTTTHVNHHRPPHHLDGIVPRRPHRRADQHRRRGTPVAGQRAETCEGGFVGDGRAVESAERDGCVLAVLRGASEGRLI